MERVYEASGTRLELIALTKDGTWLKLIEVQLDRAELYELYHFPLIFKVCCRKYDSQSKDQDLGDC